MEKYIITVDENKVHSLDLFDGVVYTSLTVIVATLREIKDICDTSGWSYEGFDEITNA